MGIYRPGGSSRSPSGGAPQMSAHQDGQPADEAEIAVAEIFEERVALRGEKRFNDGGRVHLSGQHCLPEVKENVFDRSTGLGAGTAHGPAVCSERRFLGAVNFPLVPEVIFIEDQDGRQLSEFLDDALVQGEGVRESLATSAIDD